MHKVQIGTMDVGSMTTMNLSLGILNVAVVPYYILTFILHVMSDKLTVQNMRYILWQCE